MKVRLAFGVILAGALLACANDETRYQAEYEAWRQERQATMASALQIVGIWPLADGDTAFGADTALPIAVPSTAVPSRAGIFRRTGTKVTVIPAPGASLKLADGATINGETELKTVMADQPTVLAFGSLRLQIEEVGDASPERRWVSVWDEEHPAVKNPPIVEAYPIDRRWRVAARFESFASPRPVKVPDVRDGVMDFVASGQLVFHVNDQEMRLTAISFPGSDEFFVMFKDETNLSTTFSGYRILHPAVVRSGQETVLDFNLAANPPCAYSSFTTCPLPPPENRLPIAVEAGEKRYPGA